MKPTQILMPALLLAMMGITQVKAADISETNKPQAWVNRDGVQIELIFNDALGVAIPSSDKVLVNGEEVNVAMYVVDGYNYVRAKDVAEALKGTEYQFRVTHEIGYKDHSIFNIITGESHVVLGGELQYQTGENKKVERTCAGYLLNRMDFQLLHTGIDDDVIEIGEREFRLVENTLLIGDEEFIALRTLSKSVGFSAEYLPLLETVVINPNIDSDLNTAQQFLDGFLKTGVGQMYSMALDGDGVLWGYNEGRQEYNPMKDSVEDVIKKSTPSILLTDVIDFAGGGAGHAYAVTKDNKLWGWGYNEFGQIGDGSKENKFEPTLIMTEVKQVAGQSYWETNDQGEMWFRHSATFVVDNADNLYVWQTARNEKGEVTNLPIEKIMENVKEVQSGDSYEVLVLTQDNELFQLGVMKEMEQGFKIADYTNVEKKLDRVNTFSAEGRRYMAIKDDNSLWTWGGYIMQEYVFAKQVLNLPKRPETDEEINLRTATPTKVLENVEWYDNSLSVLVKLKSGEMYGNDASTDSGAPEFDRKIKIGGESDRVEMLNNMAYYTTRAALLYSGELAYVYIHGKGEPMVWELDIVEIFMDNISKVEIGGSKLSLGRLPFSE